MEKTSKEARRNNIIAELNKAKEMELHAITQDVNQHYNPDDIDYGKLAGKIKLNPVD